MSRIVPLSLLLVLTTTPAFAQDPSGDAPTTRLVPFAGTLTDARGAALAGSQTVTFSLFDQRDGGTQLWTETQALTADTQGRFTAHLGASAALPLEIFRTEQARWLEVTVDGRAQPRVMLVAVPYALRAADAETLAGRSLSEFVLADRDGRRVRADGTTLDDPAVDGTGVPNQLAKWSSPTTLSSSIITESFDNRLGVLAPDPTGGGVVDSRVTIRNPDNNTAISVLSPLNGRRFALNTTSAGWTLYDGFFGTWNEGLTQIDGRVSVGGFSGDTRLSATAFGNGVAVGGIATGGVGVNGLATFGGTGVRGTSNAPNGNGVHGSSVFGVAVRGTCTTIAGCFAGFFEGNVTITGGLTKGGGAFRIDHPLDPANKYLQHSFVESPDMMNVYNGNVVLDGQGEAWVTLPDWFEALNRDFRYQLTSIGAPGPNLYIAEKVSGNRFKIAGGPAGGEVSWMVTGIRQDAWANANRIPVELAKPADKRDR